MVEGSDGGVGVGGAFELQVPSGPRLPVGGPVQRIATLFLCPAGVVERCYIFRAVPEPLLPRPPFKRRQGAAFVLAGQGAIAVRASLDKVGEVVTSASIKGDDVLPHRLALDVIKGIGAVGALRPLAFHHGGNPLLVAIIHPAIDETSENSVCMRMVWDPVLPFTSYAIDSRSRVEMAE